MTSRQGWVTGRLVGILLMTGILIWDGHAPWAWTLILAGLAAGVAGWELWAVRHGGTSDG